MRVLVACEYSGTVRDAFHALGHEAMSCDLLPTETPGPHYQGDVFDVINRGWDLMIAHPPCTRLTNSGVRWLHKAPTGRTEQEMWDELNEAAHFYKRLRAACIPKKAIENPIMHKYARALIEPGFRQVVQPWWFGDPYFKATGLELINLPALVPTQKLIPPGKRHLNTTTGARCICALPVLIDGKNVAVLFQELLRQWPSSGEMLSSLSILTDCHWMSVVHYVHPINQQE